MTEYVGSWKWTSADQEGSGIVSLKGMGWQQTNPSRSRIDIEPILARLMRHFSFYPELLECPACGSTKIQPWDQHTKGHNQSWECRPCNNKSNTLAAFLTTAESHLAKCYRCGGKGFMQFQCKKWCRACHGRGWLRI